MKALILKDLYNISHNAKQMLGILVIFAISFIPGTGISGYAVASCLVCSMMIVTTFSFDQQVHWEKFALILPLSKKTYIQSKFITAVIFTLSGVAVSLLVNFLIVPFFHKSTISEAMVSIGIGTYIGILFGSLSIMLVIRFGVENVRVISTLLVVIPMLGIFAIAEGLKKTGVNIELLFQKIPAFLYLLLPFAFLCFIIILSYQLSLFWFSRKEW